MVFVEGREPEEPEKNPQSKDENQQQTKLTWRQVRESNPDHKGGRWALSFSAIHAPFLPTAFLLILSLDFNMKFCFN